MKLVNCKVTGVAAPDRNFFGSAVQKHLEKDDIDLRIDWSGGDTGTVNIRVVIDCCEFTFPRVNAGFNAALKDTYLAAFRVEPKHDPAKAVAA